MIVEIVVHDSNPAEEPLRVRLTPTDGREFDLAAVGRLVREAEAVDVARTLTDC